MLLLLRPADLRFTQDDISPVFEDGHTLADTLAEIFNGRLKVDCLLPLVVMEKHGYNFVIDGNRRLYLYRMLEECGYLKTVRVNKVPYERKAFSVVYATKNRGASAFLRGNNSVFIRNRVESLVFLHTYNQPKKHFEEGWRYKRIIRPAPVIPTPVSPPQPPEPSIRKTPRSKSVSPPVPTPRESALVKSGSTVKAASAETLESCASAVKARPPTPPPPVLPPAPPEPAPEIQSRRSPPSLPSPVHLPTPVPSPVHLPTPVPSPVRLPTPVPSPVLVPVSEPEPEPQSEPEIVPPEESEDASSTSAWSWLLAAGILAVLVLLSRRK